MPKMDRSCVADVPSRWQARSRDVRTRCPETDVLEGQAARPPRRRRSWRGPPDWTWRTIRDRRSHVTGGSHPAECAGGNDGQPRGNVTSAARPTYMTEVELTGEGERRHRVPMHGHRHGAAGAEWSLFAARDPGPRARAHSGPAVADRRHTTWHPSRGARVTRQRG